MLVNLHDRSLVATSVAVVRRTENGHYVAILTPIVSLHHQLMRSGNQSQAIVVIESLRDVLAERISCSSRTDTPSTPIIRIAPQQVAHRALVRDFLNAVEAADVVQCVDARRETSMEAENLVIDEGSEWEIVEEVSEELPDVCVAIFA